MVENASVVFDDDDEQHPLAKIKEHTSAAPTSVWRHADPNLLVFNRLAFI
jgi:hypothetical protein